MTNRVQVQTNGLIEAHLTNGHRNVSSVPNHVAIIMDGNARWARQHDLTVTEGHKAGYENIERVIEHLGKREVRETTLFAFSTENWFRPEDEVQSLMDLAAEAIQNDVQKFHQRGVRLRHIGTSERLPKGMLKEIAAAEKLTESNDAFSLNLAFDYGGRREIVNAVKRMMDDGIRPDQVDEALIESYLLTSGNSDPDMVIRTGGEFRISNFMIWQSAYAEFYSAKVLWPDFGEVEIDEAISAYSTRQRRFGKRPA